MRDCLAANSSGVDRTVERSGDSMGTSRLTRFVLNTDWFRAVLELSNGSSRSTLNELGASDMLLLRELFSLRLRSCSDRSFLGLKG